MKNLYLYILIILSLVLFENKAYAAYCNTPASTVAITPTGTAQNTPTYTSGRRAFTFNATAGCTYSFSTCGNTSQDTYLRLYSGNGGTLLVSADDQCGTQSSISWTCPTTGAYSILLTRYSCNALNGAAYMTYSVSCPPPPPPCASNDITLTMNDSWGDGWNGGSITLTNNSGGSYGPYSITGSAGSESLCLPDDCYSINMVPGSYPGEITWSLSNGVSGDGSYGNQSNVFTLGSGSCGAVTGCTDPAAVNYNPLATLSDGSCIYPPSNDACANATALPCGTSNLAGTTVNSVSETAPGGGGWASNFGVWHTFTGNGQQTTISSTGTGGFDHEMTVLSGSCGALTLLTSIDGWGANGTETYTFNTVNGTVYYVYVAHWLSSGTSADVGTFTISRSCITPTPPPANDDCANAQSIAIQCTAAATAVSGTTANATEEAIADPSCDPGTIQDVWYTFNSGNNSSVDLSVTLGTASWLGGEIHTTCGTPAPGLTIGGNPGNCDYYLLNPAPTNISGLTPNTDYRLRLFTNVDFDIAGTFTFTLTYTGNSTAVAPSSISGTNAVCFGQNTTLTLQGGSPGINGVAQWFAGSCGSTVIGTGNSITVSPTANTTYFVRYAGTCITTPCVSSTVTLPTPSNSLSGVGVTATCTVNQNGYIHLLSSNGDLVASINSNGQNLGTVTATSFIEGSPLLLESCNNPGNAALMTSVLDRHWVITTQFPPSAPVNVLLPFTEGEFSSLNFEAFNNANPNDDVLSFSELGSTKYSGPNEDDLFPNNCASNGGSGNMTWHTQTSNGQVNTYLASHPGTNRFITIDINSFSEFWLHGASNSTPLPVELISFQANCTDENKVDLTWSTASENNSMHFIVETSKDAVNWEVLSIVPAAHFSTSILNYSIIHKGAAREKNYYRLKQVDQDGAFEYYNMIYANCGNVRGNPVTFPNPSKDNFTIDFNGSDMSGEVQLSLMNMEGKEISNRQLNLEKGVNTIQINTVELQPGIYYIKLFDLTGRVFIIKHCFM